MTFLNSEPFGRSQRLSATRRSVLALVTIGVAATCALVVEAAVGAPAPAVSFIRSAGPIDAKRTIIVVNGGPGVDSQFTFRGLRGLSSTSRRVIAYDQRGVGRTPMPRSGLTINVDYSLDAFVADLEALRTRLRVARIDLVGHSFGALVASAYTATHPNRVRSLILVSGLPLSLAAQQKGDARFEKRLARLQRTGIVPQAIPDSCHERERALLPVYVGNPDRAVAIGKALGTSVCDDLVGAIANDSIIHDPRRRQLESALAHYHGPALIAIGALDPFGAEWADDDARPLRQAQVTKKIVPRAGHFLWLESPTFLPLLRTFINRT